MALCTALIYFKKWFKEHGPHFKPGANAYSQHLRTHLTLMPRNPRDYMKKMWVCVCMCIHVCVSTWHMHFLQGRRIHNTRFKGGPRLKEGDTPLQEVSTSLVVQWLRIHLPMQGTRVRTLVQEDPTCRGATKPTRHNYWAHALQLPKPAHLEPMLRNKRSHHSEKPVHCNRE